MSRPHVYLDEDVYYALAVGLRGRGFDVLTTLDAGRSGASDEEQLRFAIEQRRCIFTFNRGHFAQLHVKQLADGKHHFGIIVCRQAPVGSVLKALCEYLSSRKAEDLLDQLVWLSAE